MSRQKRITKDTKCDDFEYMNLRKSSQKKLANDQEITEVRDSAQAQMAQMTEASAKKKKEVSSVIRQLEARIQELECDQLLQAEKIRTAKSADSKSMCLNDILQQAGDVDDFLSGKHLLPTDNIASTMENDPTGSSANSNRKMKSGYDIKVQEDVCRVVLWPHGFLNKLQNLTDTSPDHLNMDAFMFGYASILLLAKDTLEINSRLEHLQQLMWHSILHGWKSARDFHYQVLREIEIGNISWQNQHEMLMFSLSAAHEKQAAAWPGSPGINTSLKPFSIRAKPEETSADYSREKYDRSLCCRLFNIDDKGCHFEKTAEGCKKLHACSLCAAKGFFNRHSAVDCKK